MKILVLNSGSSSLKYQVIDMETEQTIAKGYFERIGQNYLSGESTFLMKNHVVIIGTSDVLYSILNSQKGIKKTHFLIMTSKDVIQKRREIMSFIDDEIDNNHIEIKGCNYLMKMYDYINTFYFAIRFLLKA